MTPIKGKILQCEWAHNKIFAPKQVNEFVGFYVISVEGRAHSK